MAGANAWGTFDVLQYIIYEYDNLSDGGVRASESPEKLCSNTSPRAKREQNQRERGGGEELYDGEEKIKHKSASTYEKHPLK